MDITKIKAAIKTAITELNTITDAEFKAKRLTALRPLTQAAKALELADSHLDKAAERTAPKVSTEAAAPVAGK